ncbi:response regulator receiver protein [Chitinispirillum alkaliphilum]|nr:response regulator receiver protein [Chitinispirillum alkaliphilum]
MYSKKILVVDDEVAILLAFKKLLQKPGIEVDTSESLEEAKEKIKSDSFSAVIADLRLSGTLGQEGFEIISAAKAKSPDTKVALITAFGNHGVEEHAKKLGADFYFEKPVSSSNLDSILQSIK